MGSDDEEGQWEQPQAVKKKQKQTSDSLASSFPLMRSNNNRRKKKKSASSAVRLFEPPHDIVMGETGAGTTLETEAALETHPTPPSPLHLAVGEHTIEGVATAVAAADVDTDPDVDADVAADPASAAEQKESGVDAYERLTLKARQCGLLGVRVPEHDPRVVECASPAEEGLLAQWYELAFEVEYNSKARTLRRRDNSDHCKRRQKKNPVAVGTAPIARLATHGGRRMEFNKLELFFLDPDLKNSFCLIVDVLNRKLRVLATVAQQTKRQDASTTQLQTATLPEQTPPPQRQPISEECQYELPPPGTSLPLPHEIRAAEADRPTNRLDAYERLSMQARDCGLLGTRVAADDVRREFVCHALPQQQRSLDWYEILFNIQDMQVVYTEHGRLRVQDNDRDEFGRLQHLLDNLTQNSSRFAPIARVSLPESDERLAHNKLEIYFHDHGFGGRRFVAVVQPQVLRIVTVLPAPWRVLRDRNEDKQRWIRRLYRRWWMLPRGLLYDLFDC